MTTTSNILDGLSEFGAELPSLDTRPKRDPDKAALPTDRDPRHTAKVEKRRLVELQQGDNATAKLGTLPAPGESLLVRMDGSFNGYDFIPAMLSLLTPATISTLHIASLSFN